jgi:hypothetical protein
MPGGGVAVLSWEGWVQSKWVWAHALFTWKQTRIQHANRVAVLEEQGLSRNIAALDGRVSRNDLR